MIKEVIIIVSVVGIVILSHAVAFGKFGTTAQKAHVDSITKVALAVPRLDKIGQK